MILTPDQRLRVFVSSTLAELAPERAAVREAIEALRLAPVMFELGARPHPPRALYRAYLAQSHVFVGLYWQRYGWIAPDMDISGLEDEFRLVGDIPKLLYLKEPAPDRDPALRRMLHEIGDASYRVFRSVDELRELVVSDLAVLLTERFTAVDTPAELVEEAPAGRHATLPRPPTTFVGRDGTLAELETLLCRDDVNLVTLTGAGGIGKTRLAVEVGHRLAPRFTDGVVLVPLAHVTEPPLVLPTIASALGVRADDAHAGLREALSHQRCLLILDNFEQVTAAAPALRALLEDCPTLTVLVTSRRVLRVTGEHELVVPPLGVPDDEVDGEQALVTAEAAALFLQRARAVRPGLRLSTEEVRAVAALCRALDGVPLALELAAARVRLLPPTVLVARLGSALDLPGDSFADLPERQRSLRATIDWSHELLTVDERRLFARLSTFVGGWTLDAAEAVCAGGMPDDTFLTSLFGLVESSLVMVDAEDPARPRFRMLTPIREHAREQLRASGELADLDARHLRYHLELAAAAQAGLSSAEQQRWLDRLEPEAGNLAAAARRAIDAGDPLVLAAPTWQLWVWLWLDNHILEARYWLQEPLRRADELDPLTRARVWWTYGSAAFEQGDYAEARPYIERATALFDELGDRQGSGYAHLIRGSLAALDDDDETTLAAYRTSTAALRAVGDRFMGAIAEAAMGLHLLLRGGDAEEAEACFAAALEHARSIDNRPMADAATLYLAFGRLVRGEVAEAEQRLLDVVAAPTWHSDEVLAYAFEGLAATALARGDASRSATLLGAAAGLRERTGLSTWPLLRPLLESLAAGTRAAMTAEAFAIAYDAGAALRRNAARQLALTGPGAPVDAAATGPAAVDGTSSTVTA